MSSHQNKWPKIFLALTESPRPCHLRTHGAVAESVADVAESEQEMVPQWAKLFVPIITKKLVRDDVDVAKCARETVCSGQKILLRQG